MTLNGTGNVEWGVNIRPGGAKMFYSWDEANEFAKEHGGTVRRRTHRATFYGELYLLANDSVRVNALVNDEQVVLLNVHGRRDGWLVTWTDGNKHRAGPGHIRRLVKEHGFGDREILVTCCHPRQVRENGRYAGEVEPVGDWAGPTSLMASSKIAYVYE